MYTNSKSILILRFKTFFYKSLALLKWEKVFVLASLLVIFTGCGSDNDHVSDEFNASLAKKLDISFKRSILENNVTGAVLAVKNQNGSIWKSSAGYSILEDKTPMSDNLSFRIGSVTKTFTATLVLMLVDNGVISLETTLNEIMPELNIVMGDKITIENLLEMRSGLSKYLANKDFFNFLNKNPGRIWTPEELIYYSNVKISEPNSTFLYNNGNYVILGLIIEKLTHMKYADAVNNYILKPLKMKNTYLPSNLNVPYFFANGYEYKSDSEMIVNLTYNYNPSVAWSSGGLISNADDLLIWANAYIDGTLISSALHEKQFTLQKAEDNIAIDSYGFGVMKYKNLIGHDGYIPPYGSWVATYKDYKFVLLLNGTNKVEIPQLVASYVLNSIVQNINN